MRQLLQRSAAPLTDSDIKRITRHTGEPTRDLVRWVDRNGIDMDDEPEAFVMLRQGKRVMVLRHEGGGCRYLGSDDHCTIYGQRPLGCRVFPFDPELHGLPEQAASAQADRRDRCK